MLDYTNYIEFQTPEWCRRAKWLDEHSANLDCDMVAIMGSRPYIPTGQVFNPDAYIESKGYKILEKIAMTGACVVRLQKI